MPLYNDAMSMLSNDGIDIVEWRARGTWGTGIALGGITNLLGNAWPGYTEWSIATKYSKKKANNTQ